MLAPTLTIALALLAPPQPSVSGSDTLTGAIAYLGLVDQTWQLFLHDGTAGTQKQLTSDAGDKRFPAWLPDGSIAFHTSDHRAFRIPPEGGTPLPIFPELWPIHDLSLSPTGSHAAFTRPRADGEDQANLWLADGLTGPARLLTKDHGIQCQPSWAPEGTRLVFMNSAAWNDCELRIVGLEPGSAKNLTKDRARKFWPAWSPDGSRIAFSSVVTGDYELWCVDPDGSHPQRLTDHPGPDTRPAWSPDSQTILFSRLDDEGWRIWRVSSVGGNATRMEGIPGPCRDPSWRALPAPSPNLAPPAIATLRREPVSGVSVTPKTLQVGPGASTRISFDLRTASVTFVDFADEHGTVVARRELGPCRPGRIETTWDGRDLAGGALPDGAYRYMIRTIDEAGEGFVYDPSTETGGQEIRANDFSFDKTTGLLKWTMPQTGLARLRAALDPSPHLRTMLEWVPLDAGPISYPWDGMDASGLVSVKDHPKCLVTLTLLALPPNTILVAGSSASPRPEPLEPAEYAATYMREGISHFARIPPDRRHDPRFDVDFLTGQTLPGGGVRVRGHVPVRVTIAPSDAQYFQSHQFEAAYFVDLALLFEEEEASHPFTFVWDTTRLEPGEHVFSVVLYGYLGQTGVVSRKVIVEQ